MGSNPLNTCNFPRNYLTHVHSLTLSTLKIFKVNIFKFKSNYFHETRLVLLISPYMINKFTFPTFWNFTFNWLLQQMSAKIAKYIIILYIWIHIYSTHPISQKNTCLKCLTLFKKSCLRWKTVWKATKSRMRY